MTNPIEITNQLQAAQENGLIPLFKQAAKKWNVPVAILLAIASRETQIGTNSYYLQNNFTGRDGHGKGIMQIDDRYHSFATVAAPSNNKANINYGARYLSELYDQFGNIEDALVAYNAGPNAVYSARSLGINPDYLTTGGDYSFDVLQRTKIIEKELGIGFAKSALGMILPALALLASGSYLYYQWQENKGKSNQRNYFNFLNL